MNQNHQLLLKTQPQAAEAFHEVIGRLSNSARTENAIIWPEGMSEADLNAEASAARRANG